MRSRIMGLAGILLLMAAAQTTIFSQAQRGGQVGLDLTDAQKAQLEELREQHKTATAEARADIIKARAEVQSLMTQPEPDLNALERAMNRLSQLENALKVQGMKNRQAYENVLTEDQKKKMRSAGRTRLLQTLRARMGQGRMFMGRGSHTFGRRRHSSMNSMRERGPGSRRGFNRGNQHRGGRGIPPGAGAAFGRGGQGNPAASRMTGRGGNADLRALMMRALMQRAGGNAPPPPPPPTSPPPAN